MTNARVIRVDAQDKALETGVNFPQYFDSQQNAVNSWLDAWFQKKLQGNRVVESACYSLMLPSKRLRPLFCLEVCRALTGSDHAARGAALALEMIHTYSLIHDDLPAMDNDDLRRGKPTNHKVFGEAVAILAGDGLLTEAFEVLGSPSDADQVSAAARVRLVLELARAAGMSGMVHGQQLDIDAPSDLKISDLETLHRKKTGALLSASIVMGAVAAGAQDEIIEQFRDFGFKVGLAFQIHDDVLDVTGGAELGKPLKSDERNQKATYVSLLGLDGARAAAELWSKKAMEALNAIVLPCPNTLRELTNYVIHRKH